MDVGVELYLYCFILYVQMLGKCHDSVENMCEKLGWGGEGRE